MISNISKNLDISIKKYTVLIEIKKKKIQSNSFYRSSIILNFQVGLNLLIQKANKFSPATKVLIQKFVPFPAVGEFILI